jgi:hypothetical protein
MQLIITITRNIQVIVPKIYTIDTNLKLLIKMNLNRYLFTQKYSK